MQVELVALVSTGVDYDPDTDTLTTQWRAFRPCKVGELEGLERAMVPPQEDAERYQVGVEFVGRRSEKLQTVVPEVIRFHGLRHWPEVASYWLATSIVPFKLVTHELNLETPSLAHLFAVAYRHFVLGKPLPK